MASPSSIELGDEVLVQQYKTNKLSSTFNPFKVISKTGNILVVEIPTLREPILQEHKSCEANIREGRPTPQQRSDSVSAPPTPQQELHSVPHTTNQPRKNRLPSCGIEQNALFCRRMVEQHQRLGDTRGQGDYQRRAMLFKIFFGEHEH